MDLYLYKGPVEEFGKIIANDWRGMTRANSESKARANLAYQYKKKYGKSSTAKITIPGELECVSELELKGDKRR